MKRRHVEHEYYPGVEREAAQIRQIDRRVDTLRESGNHLLYGKMDVKLSAILKENVGVVAREGSCGNRTDGWTIRPTTRVDSLKTQSVEIYPFIIGVAVEDIPESGYIDFEDAELIQYIILSNDLVPMFVKKTVNLCREVENKVGIREDFDYEYIYTIEATPIGTIWNGYEWVTLYLENGTEAYLSTYTDEAVYDDTEVLYSGSEEFGTNNEYIGTQDGDVAVQTINYHDSDLYTGQFLAGAFGTKYIKKNAVIISKPDQGTPPMLVKEYHRIDGNWVKFSENFTEGIPAGDEVYTIMVNDTVVDVEQPSLYLSYGHGSSKKIGVLWKYSEDQSGYETPLYEGGPNVILTESSPLDTVIFGYMTVDNIVKLKLYNQILGHRSNILTGNYNEIDKRYYLTVNNKQYVLLYTIGGEVPYTDGLYLGLCYEE